jgi:adenine-specific DNA-methyltransferase
MASKVTATKHKDKRANIPTEELRDFVKDDERAPKKQLYPRDPSLDPQLVWKGKDEQDAADLAVDVVPVYIQEKIHPLAIVEDVRASAAKTAEPQADLFADFNGIKFEDYVDFYHHGLSWSNRMILGDSLLVMASLAQKEGLKEKVQMIYMDPPYGIKFGSNWQVSTRKRDVKDGKLDDVTRQPEQIRAFRDTWELRIHSYLPYLRDRLVAARDLLTESGSIFVQIGDENVHLVRSVMDEVFGSENFCSQITCSKTTGTTGRLLPGTADYVLWFARDIERVKYAQLLKEKAYGGEGASMYTLVEMPSGERRRLTPQEGRDLSLLPTGARICRLADLTSPRVREGRTGYYPITLDGKRYLPRKGEWKTHREGIDRLLLAGRIALTGDTPAYVRYIDDFPAFSVTNIWNDLGAASDKFYVVQTGTTIVERCLLMATDPGDLVIDPTCGSGTTAYVAEQRGRRWITCDTSRVALALARTRLMSARYPYYLLSDSADGIRKEAELAGRPPISSNPQNDVKKGFVYKRVPHIQLKSIANNEEIDAIHAKYEAQLTPIRAKLNAALKQSWEEWEIPRDPDVKWSKTASALHSEWCKLRLARQKEIDASIARRADTEFLYDQPYEDSKRIRVSGPFTVESLSPHRVLKADEERPASETEGAREAEGDFVTRILEYLKKSGVQNTVKQERLTFDRLEPYAGEWIQASGEYRTADGKAQRVAVTIGPQYGTVGPDLVKEAAKEAVRGVGFDLLIVCGFALDPHVAEETRRYGKLTVLTPRMNPDMLMGDGLLKKTGAANLFMVFGEPDLDVKPLADGRIQVELKGLDVYDPTTQEIRNNSTDQVACWFIDTSYNGESFFVRHAYFTGADQPYERLRKALKAEVDEAAWASLYSTVSRPFEKPKTGKIAVKVINHYGDEVLKVYRV